MIRNFGRFVLLVLLLTFALPLLPYAIALAQSTAVASSTPVADTVEVVKDAGVGLSAIVAAVVALIAAIAAYLGGRHGATRSR